jgi:hypothetical protein
MASHPGILLYGRTALGANVPVQVDADGKLIGSGGGGSGTVTSVSVTTANGVSGSVATATTTPEITLTLGDITPSSVTFANDATPILWATSGVSLMADGVSLLTNAHLRLPIDKEINWIGGPSISADGFELSLNGGGLIIDGDANAAIGGNLAVTGTTSLDNGAITTDGAGALTATAFVGVPQVPVTAVGSLPSPVGIEGQIRGVNDALLPAALAIVAAGGAVHVPVYSDGTNWRVM